jgi:Sybindin-like family
MTVHSFHIFDRRGKTLFTKRYFKVQGEQEETAAQKSDQQKLIYGMLHSLKEICGTMSPLQDDVGDVHLIKTGAATVYNLETVSGLRFVIFTTAETSVGRSPSSSGPQVTSPTSTTPILTSPAGTSGGTNTPIASPPSSHSAHGLAVPNTTNLMTLPHVTAQIRSSLQHIYEHLWVNLVVRSPLYQPQQPNLEATNFEVSLDNYLKGMPWFR